MSSAPSRPRAEHLIRGRVLLRMALALVAATLLVAWLARGPLLRALGGALVAEDAIAPADVIAVSHANARASALEAAALYREGVAPRIVVAEARRDELKRRLDALGVVIPTSEEIIVTILEHAGVPREAITVLPGAVDGTNAELAVYARFANRERPGTLLYITSRTHTARAGWRLRREVPGTRILVRAPRTDDFHVDTWWLRRGSTREVMTEYLRGFNTYLLGDHWRASRDAPAGESPGGSAVPAAP